MMRCCVELFRAVSWCGLTSKEDTLSAPPGHQTDRRPGDCHRWHRASRVPRIAHRARTSASCVVCIAYLARYTACVVCSYYNYASYGSYVESFVHAIPLSSVARHAYRLVVIASRQAYPFVGMHFFASTRQLSVLRHASCCCA